MRKKPNNLIVYIVLILIAVGIGIYVIISNSINSDYNPDYNLDNAYVMPSRKVDVNEYKVATVREDEMVSTYFNTFITLMLETPQKSFTYIDSDYKELKYNNDINKYVEHIKVLTNDYTYLPKIDVYKKEILGTNTIYNVLDTNGNKYIFSIEAVMKYRVYLDEDTIKVE